MTDRPILFSPPMVEALLAGRKTQTRRALKVLNASMLDAAELDGGKCLLPLVRFKVGDRLWVRESHALFGRWSKSGERWNFYEHSTGLEPRVVFDALDKCSAAAARDTGVHWCRRPGIHLPRWASRLTLTVTDVRVQRLSEITEEDAQAESFKAGQLNDGFGPRDMGGGYTVESPGTYASAVGMFLLTWQELHPDWDGYSDPWVVALTYSVEHRNIDA